MPKSNLTTLCYLEKDGKYLMMHRVKKEHDINKDKWVGIGGHFEADESPEECLLREAREETGLTLANYKLRGIVTFISDRWQTEYMFLYTATEWEGQLADCNEDVPLYRDRVGGADYRVQRRHAGVDREKQGLRPAPVGRGQDLLPAHGRKSPVFFLEAQVCGRGFGGKGAGWEGVMTYQEIIICANFLFLLAM